MTGMPGGSSSLSDMSAPRYAAQLRTNRSDPAASHLQNSFVNAPSTITYHAHTAKWTRITSWSTRDALAARHVRIEHNSRYLVNSASGGCKTLLKGKDSTMEAVYIITDQLSWSVTQVGCWRVCAGGGGGVGRGQETQELQIQARRHLPRASVRLFQNHGDATLGVVHDRYAARSTNVGSLKLRDGFSLVQLA